jgi:ring-1,2-phenylacetyl-CoA epoxidase subunit PaaE
MSELFFPLKIKRIVRETKDAASFVFDIPENLKEKFAYLPGQYLTLSTTIGGKEVRRAYSFSSSPITDESPAVTIKKVADGVFSSFMNDDAFEGQVIQVMPPMGKFVVHLDAANKNHYVLFAGGSGITPVMSIMKSVIDKEPNSRITLIYCNRDEESVIFKQQLAAMQTQYAAILKVVYCYDIAPAGWTGINGRPSAAHYMDMVKATRLDGFNTEYYICGPTGMMDEVKNGLQTLGVPGAKVHNEYFSAPSTKEPVTTSAANAAPIYDEGEAVAGGSQKAIIILNGHEHEITVPKGTTILEAAKDEDLDPPYACQIGVCTTCRAKLLEGQVEMDEREGLSDSEISQGYILTCQSHPTTPKVKLIYE